MTTPIVDPMNSWAVGLTLSSENLLQATSYRTEGNFWLNLCPADVICHHRAS